jgi:hypothetical protein
MIITLKDLEHLLAFFNNKIFCLHTKPLVFFTMAAPRGNLTLKSFMAVVYEMPDQVPEMVGTGGHDV